MFIGKTAGKKGVTYRSLLRFDLSCVPRDSVVQSSSLGLYFQSDTSPTSLEIEANALTRSFTEEANWAKYDGKHAWTTAGGDFSPTTAGTQTVLDSWRGGWVSWGFTPLVQQWISTPSTNYGMLLKARSEASEVLDEYVRTPSESTGGPTLSVAYSPRLGSEEGDVLLGEVAVNAANGNLFVTSPDIAYAGEGYETKLTRYYNSLDENQSGDSFGPSWRLSAGSDTLLDPSWWDRSNALRLPGGAIERFTPEPPAPSSAAPSALTYTASPDPEQTLSISETGTRTLKFNETGVEWHFDNSENGFPQTIVEPEGSGNTISLNYVASRLSKVTDTHGHSLAITPESETHNISKIESSSGEKWEYHYNSSHDLTSYKSPTGAETTYGYAPAALLNEIKTPSGTYIITYDTSERVQSLRKIVNGTTKEVGSEDEITTYEYKTPESPTCNPATDAAETIVTYKPSGATQAYCFDANDHFTGPPTATETEAEESPETSEEQTEIPAGTCWNAGEEWNDCEMAEEPPEPEEDLVAERYGISDNNWLLTQKEHETKQGEVIPEGFGSFDYMTNPYFESLAPHIVRRTIPWNTVIQARLDEEHPEHEGKHGYDPGARARREDTEKWAEEAAAKHEIPLLTFDRCPKGASWTDPVWEEEHAEAKRARERAIPEHPAPEATALEEHAAETESCETPPRRKSYEYAMRLFHQRTAFSSITHFTAWNEPNLHANVEPEPTWNHAEVAGELWRVLDDMCLGWHSNCQVAAGDFSDLFMGNAKNRTTFGGQYLEKYARGTGRPTTLYRWALHSYGDGVATQEPNKRNRPKTWWGRFKNFRAAIDKKMSHPKCGSCEKPKIWLTEQGVVSFEDGKGTGPVVGEKTEGITKVKVRAPLWSHWNLAEGELNAFVHRPAKGHEESHQLSDQKQVSMFLYYAMLGNPATFDSGLLEASSLPEGSPRAAAEHPREHLYSIYRTKTLKGG